MDTQRIESVESVAQVGDEITVMVTQVSPDGKIRLSRKAVLEGWSLEEAQAADKPRDGGGSRGRGGSGRGNNNRRNNRR